MGVAKFETFYKTAAVFDQEDHSPVVPEETNDQFEISAVPPAVSHVSEEYYMLVMMPLPLNCWVVWLHHGWWDDGGRQPKLTAMVLNTTNEPLTESEAIRLYIEQRSYLLSQGFVYIVGPSGEREAVS